MSKRSICMVGVLLALLLALAAIPAAALAPPSAALEPVSAATGERTRSTVVAAGFAPAAAYLPEAVIGAGQMGAPGLLLLLGTGLVVLAELILLPRAWRHLP